jgi:hypothetical protein
MTTAGGSPYLNGDGVRSDDGCAELIVIHDLDDAERALESEAEQAEMAAALERDLGRGFLSDGVR